MVTILPGTLNPFDLAYEAAYDGKESAFQQLLQWLISPDEATRDAAACSVAELLYRDKLDHEQTRMVEGVTAGWTRAIWNSGFDTDYLLRELLKAIERFEGADNER